MKGVNLIPGSRSAARRVRARVRLWIGVCGAYAVLLGAAYAWMFSAWGGRTQNWQARLAQVERETREANQVLSKRRSTLDESEANLRANSIVGDQPDWSMLLGLLARKLRDEVVLEQTVLRVSDSSGKPGAAGPVLALTGLGRTHAAVSEFVLRLEQSGVFSKVTQLESRRTALPKGEAVGFRVEATLATGEGGAR
jgi:Tfp pilus assembly protein PilN